MAGYRAQGGVEVTDAMIDQWDAEADAGIYHGTPGELIINKPLGRPSLYGEAMVPVTFRLPADDAAALRAAAKRRGVSFADIMREACRRELREMAD